MGLVTVIGTAPGRGAWVNQCVRGLAGHDVIVLELGYGYELGKIRDVFDMTDLDRFLFLQDSVEILSETFWGRLSEHDGSVGLMPEPGGFGCYMGVYERKHLAVMDWPVTLTKEDSIREEAAWCRRYANVSGASVLFPELVDREGTVREHLGRTNLVLENEHFRKWKGTYR